MRLSSKQSAIRRRINSLPQIFEKSLRTVYKYQADELAKTFEEGISQRRLNLVGLKTETIERKRRQGLSKPKTELFGRGDYSRMMVVTQQGKKWVVAPKRGTHHSGLKYKDILDVHEKGRTITRVSKSGKTINIRIPPRPARTNSYKLWLRRRKRIDTNRQVWKAINEQIKKA